MAEVFGFDAYSPKEIAEKVENVGVVKARLPLISMSMLGILAGGFIGLGAMFFTLVQGDASLSFAASRLLGGLVFSLGLILVVIAGAELFTGNNFLMMAWVAGKISFAELLKNLVVVYFTNFVGAVGLAALVFVSNHWLMNGGAVGAAAVKIAAAKTSLPFMEALTKGILCNILVCLAVWLSIAGRNVVDKILAIVFPITAFVACGFEHSVANMYFIPLGILLRDHAPSGTNIATLDFNGMLSNLLPVTIGNVIGGAVMVALVYYVIYRRGAKP